MSYLIIEHQPSRVNTSVIQCGPCKAVGRYSALSKTVSGAGCREPKSRRRDGSQMIGKQNNCKQLSIDLATERVKWKKIVINIRSHSFRIREGEGIKF